MLGNVTYCEEVSSLSQEFGGKVQLISGVDDEQMAHLYATSVLTVLPSTNDCNPRAVYESLWANTPFLVTRAARISPTVEHLGYVVQGHGTDMIKGLVDALRDVVKLKWKKEQITFAERDDQGTG